MANTEIQSAGAADTMHDLSFEELVLMAKAKIAMRAAANMLADKWGDQTLAVMAMRLGASAADEVYEVESSYPQKVQIAKLPIVEQCSRV